MSDFTNRPPFQPAIVAAIDAGLRELARQGAVRLPQYCGHCGEMHPRGVPKRCPRCGLE